MKHRMKIVMGLLVVAMGIHLYISYTHYSIKIGASDTKSFCNIGKTFNCDAVASSEYASFMGVSTSSIGLAFNAGLLLMLIFLMFGIPENQERGYRQAYWFSGLIALASIIFGIIALTQLSVFCIYCMILYLISFIVMYLLYKHSSPTFKDLPSDISSLFKSSPYILGSLISIPIIALIIHGSIQRKLTNGIDIDKIVRSSIQEWQTNSLISFPPEKASLTKGEGSFAIVEFADFLCGHCKKASLSLSAFVASHKNVRMLFYNFPLDGSCNPSIPVERGISCRLAKAAHCSKSWALHDKFYENQKDMSRSHFSNIDKKIKILVEELQLNWPNILECMNSSVTHQMIESQVEMGEKADVHGTPSIFANGRFLPRGQMLHVLGKALEVNSK